MNDEPEYLYQLEFIKQYFDLFKHITTLDSGSIVILATFMALNLGQTISNWLVRFCVILFIISLVVCVLGMIWINWFTGVIGGMNSGGENINNSGRCARILFGISIGSFLIGVISLAVFVIVNVKL